MKPYSPPTIETVANLYLAAKGAKTHRTLAIERVLASGLRYGYTQTAVRRAAEDLRRADGRAG